MAGVEHMSTLASVPSVDSEPADSEVSGIATSDTTGNTSQGSPDQLALLRCSTCATWTTSVEVLEFCIIGRCHPAQHPGCVGWSVHLSPFQIMPVHQFCGKYSVSTLYLYHPISAMYHSLLALRGIPSMRFLWWIFGQGDWIKGYLVWVQLPHQKKSQESNPYRDS